MTERKYINVTCAYYLEQACQAVQRNDFTMALNCASNAMFNTAENYEVELVQDLKAAILDLRTKRIQENISLVEGIITKSLEVLTRQDIENAKSALEVLQKIILRNLENIFETFLTDTSSTTDTPTADYEHLKTIERRWNERYKEINSSIKQTQAYIKELSGKDVADLTFDECNELEKSLDLLKRLEPTKNKRMHTTWEEKLNKREQDNKRKAKFKATFDAAHKASQIGNFVEAQKALDEARQAAGTNQQAKIEQQQLVLNQQQKIYLGILTDSLRQLMALPLTNFTDAHIEQGNHLLKQLEEAESNKIIVEIWRQRWNLHKDNYNTHHQLNTLSRTLATHWQVPKLLLVKYQEAFRLVQEYVDSYPDKAEFVVLLEKAEKELIGAQEQVHKLHQQAQEDLNILLKETRVLLKEGYLFLPWYEKESGVLHQKELVPAADAVARVEHMYVEERVTKLLEWLRTNPDAVIKEFEQLKANTELNLESLKYIESAFNKEVEPVQETLATIRENLQVVKQKIDGKNHEDYREAWRLFREIIEQQQIHDLDWSEVRKMRNKVIPKYKEFLDKEFRRIRQEMIGPVFDRHDNCDRLRELLDETKYATEFSEQVKMAQEIWDEFCS